jgi:hypothetical protein
VLRAIIGMGGSITFSRQGRDIEIALAAEFGLPDDVRDFKAPHYHAQENRKWRNHLQFVRNDLVLRGEIDDSVRDEWIVTPAGYHRVGMIASNNP